MFSKSYDLLSIEDPIPIPSFIDEFKIQDCDIRHFKIEFNLDYTGVYYVGETPSVHVMITYNGPETVPVVDDPVMSLRANSVVPLIKDGHLYIDTEDVLDLMNELYDDQENIYRSAEPRAERYRYLSGIETTINTFKLFCQRLTTKYARKPEKWISAVSREKPASPNYTEKVNFSATNRYGCGPSGEDDVYTIAEFVEQCNTGGFVDDDGFGYPVKDGKAAVKVIVPSRLYEIPADATHVVWFNQ